MQAIFLCISVLWKGGLLGNLFNYSIDGSGCITYHCGALCVLQRVQTYRNFQLWKHHLLLCQTEENRVKAAVSRGVSLLVGESSRNFGAVQALEMSCSVTAHPVGTSHCVAGTLLLSQYIFVII